jgi:N6-L-threonylcarbamoyladenine synthase/protein kinase Bud32
MQTLLPILSTARFRFVDRGAEARIYRSSLFGRKIVIKQREPKAYRAKQLDVSLRRSRTKNETNIMLKAAAAGVRVPTVYMIGDYEIWMEQLEGELLREKKIPPEQYVTIGKILAKLHKAGIAHGDFTPANIFICDDRNDNKDKNDNKDRIQFAVIDFGLSTISRDLEEQAVDVLLMQKAIDEKSYRYFIEGYKQDYERWKEVLQRADEIKRRGRYWERSEKV